MLACCVVEPGSWCRRCGCQGIPRDSVVRRLPHEPMGWRPTTLLVTIRRYRCSACGQFEVVAMDGFTGFKTAATKELPDASR